MIHARVGFLWDTVFRDDPFPVLFRNESGDYEKKETLYVFLTFSWKNFKASKK